MPSYLTLLIAIAVVFVVAKFILHFSLKKIIGLVINSLIGFAILYVINLTGIITIPINIITCLVVGIFGVPGVLVLIALVLLHVI